MFASKKKKKNTSLETVVYSTIIEEGIVIEGGVLKGEGNVRINGHYTGDITIEGNIAVGVRGLVKGDICANSADISGTTEGNITAFSLIHLSATAVVEGSIQCETVIIDENAKFNGTCEMGAIPLSSKDKDARSLAVRTV